MAPRLNVDRTDPVLRTAHRVGTALNRARLPYAIAGGAAVSLRGANRATNDVGLVLTHKTFGRFQRLVRKLQIDQVPGKPRRFRDRVHGTRLEIMIAGMNAGRMKRSEVSIPTPSNAGEMIGDLKVVGLLPLVELKLAAGRFNDFADIVFLIREHCLNESFAVALHPSLRPSFESCLAEHRRELEFIARNG